MSTYFPTDTACRPALGLCSIFLVHFPSWLRSAGRRGDPAKSSKQRPYPRWNSSHCAQLAELAHCVDSGLEFVSPKLPLPLALTGPRRCAHHACCSWTRSASERARFYSILPRPASNARASTRSPCLATSDLRLHLYLPVPLFATPPLHHLLLFTAQPMRARAWRVQLVSDAISLADMELRRPLCQQIVLAGGATLMHGMR